MSFLDKMLGSMKYDDDDDYDDFDDYDEEYEEPRRPARRPRTAIEDEPEPAPRKRVNTAPKNGRNRVMSNGMEVCVIKPTTFEDTREITDTLLEDRTVLLNMEGLDVDLAQRIIDFTSGSTYAIDGNLQKISHYIFILTPRNVDVSGDFQEILSGAFDVPALNNKF